jgi:hypothetical protein
MQQPILQTADSCGEAGEYQFAPDSAKLIKIAAEAEKDAERAIPNMNDFLQKVVALDTAIIGGAFLIAKGDVLPYPWTVFSLSLFVLSMGVAFAGLFPRPGEFDEDTAEGIRQYKRYDIEIGKIKGWCMIVAVGLVMLGFVVGTVGLLIKGKPEDPKATRVIIENQSDTK